MCLSEPNELFRWNFQIGKKSCVQWKCRTNLYFLFHCVSGLFQKPPPPSFHGVQQHQAPPIYKSINSRFFTHFTGAGIFVFLEPLLLVATENSVSYKPYKLYMLQLRGAKNYRDLRMHLSLSPRIGCTFIFLMMGFVSVLCTSHIILNLG